MLGVAHRRQRRDHVPQPVGPHELVVEAHRVDATVGELMHRGSEPGRPRCGHQAGVRAADQIVDRLPHELGQGLVGPHEPAGQGHRAHADRGFFEHLAEALEVLGQDLPSRLRVLDDRGLDGFLDRRRVRPCAVAMRGQHLEQVVGQGAHRQGFLEQRGRAQLVGPLLQAAGVEAGEHDDLGVRRRLQDPGQRLEAVHVRHGDVEQQQVGPVGRGELDRLHAVGTLAHDIEQTGQLQVCFDQSAHVCGVVHHHHGGITRRHDGKLAVPGALWSANNPRGPGFRPHVPGSGP